MVEYPSPQLQLQLPLAVIDLSSGRVCPHPKAATMQLCSSDIRAFLPRRLFIGCQARLLEQVEPHLSKRV